MEDLLMEEGNIFRKGIKTPVVRLPYSVEGNLRGYVGGIQKEGLLSRGTGFLFLVCGLALRPECIWQFSRMDRNTSFETKPVVKLL